MRKAIVLPVVAEKVIGGEKDKNDERENLKGQAEERHIDASLVAARGHGAEGTAGGLEDERDDVARNEEPVKEFGIEPSEREVQKVDARGVRYE